jgi:hypothetical protein
MQDIGFVHYWWRQDYRAASAWFDKASKIPGAPWFLQSLAATTLAAGGDRQSSRTMWEAIRQSAEVDWLTYIPTVSRPWEDTTWKGETGRVDDLVRKYTDSWGLAGDSTTAYLCGHPSMIENTKGILKRHGWEAGAIREEAFFVPAKNAAAS